MAKYLYNGIELPALPAWDNKTYPYVLIFNLAPFGYKGLFFTNNPPIPKSGSTTSVVYEIGTQQIYYTALEDSEAWKFVKNKTFDDGSYYLNWTNTNILNTDGSVYLPASYPIDAETGEEIHDYEVGNNEPEEPETPDPLPVSPYLCQNGVWVKSDVYKQVGNTWVKQPQGAFEVEGGAWSALS